MEDWNLNLVSDERTKSGGLQYCKVVIGEKRLLLGRGGNKCGRDKNYIVRQVIN